MPNGLSLSWVRWGKSVIIHNTFNICWCILTVSCGRLRKGCKLTPGQSPLGWLNLTGVVGGDRWGYTRTWYTWQQWVSVCSYSVYCTGIRHLFSMLLRIVIQCNHLTYHKHVPLSLFSRFFYFVHTLFCIYCIWWLQWSAIKLGGLGTERCPPPPHKQHSHRNRYRWVFTILHTLLHPGLRNCPAQLKI